MLPAAARRALSLNWRGDKARFARVGDKLLGLPSKQDRGYLGLIGSSQTAVEFK